MNWSMFAATVALGACGAASAYLAQLSAPWAATVTFLLTVAAGALKSYVEPKPIAAKRRVKAGK